MIDLKNLTIHKAEEAFKNKEFSVRDLVSAYLDVIKSRDGEVHAYLEVFDDVLSQADQAQKDIDAGNIRALTGIPIALKDNMLVTGKKVSAGSKILENFVASYDATAVGKLKDAGAIIIGRTNMDEFAMGSSTENSAYGPTRNPLDTSRVPGGSSGGSAAAVAMDGALLSLGSDTGGSVRQPASLTGIVGLKPTYGAISRYGLIALGSSLDQIGPFGKTVTDVETLFDVLKGTDSMDSTSFYPEEKAKVKKQMTIGVPRNLLDGLTKESSENLEQAISRFKELGYAVKDITLPNLKYALAAYYVIQPAEASSNLARFDGVRYGLHIDGKDLLDDYVKTKSEGFGQETRRRIILGTYVLSSGYYDAYYNKAVAIKTLIKADYDNAFKDVDLVLTPTTAGPAFLLGEKMNDPLQMYLEDVFTVPANISGNPAISIPAGTTKVGDKELPLGVQLVAAHYREDPLFRAGKDFLGEAN